MESFNHLDSEGNAIMVDVSDKSNTKRKAVASGIITMNDTTMKAIETGTAAKGDVLATARIAGIMAVKNTQHLIPMCHPLLITKCSIDFQKLENGIKAICTVSLNGQTGVEMEALTGAGIALLTVYDMCKAMDKRMEISSLHLDKKSGGKSGDFLR